MFSFANQTRVYLAVKPVDIRKSFDGLWAEATRSLGGDPFAGSLFVFSNKKRNLVKILHWDGSGVCVLGKRLEKGCFSWPKGSDPKRLSITPQALGMILAGIDLKEGAKKVWFER